MLLAIYWPSLGAWFQADDFAWLALARQVHDFPSLLHALFAPMAQGTIRPWSERGFFLVFSRLFGIDPLPMRLFVFASACGCLVLLGIIACRIIPAQARLAAVIAPLAWIVSAGLSTPISWASDYNQIQCSLFLLGAFSLRLRGNRWAELVVFILGFGSLELNIVYPALALAWILFSAPRDKWSREIVGLVPLFAISVVYFLVHRHFAPAPTTGPYVLEFNKYVFHTLNTYWRWAMLGPHFSGGGRHYRAVVFAFVFIFSLALAVGLWIGTWRERRIFLFGLAWFAITLAPLLPLRYHVSDYYLTIPALGLAWSIAVAVASSRAQLGRGSALTLFGLYFVVNARAARASADWFTARASHARTLVLGAATAETEHPGEAILLTGVDDDLYSATFANSAFAILGVPHVYLAPDDAAHLHASDSSNSPEKFVLPPGPALHALEGEQLEVYRIHTDPHGDRLQNVTAPYTRFAETHFEEIPPKRVDVANPLMAYLLGPEWYPLESGHRWMPQRATVRMGGPSADHHHLVLSGFCPEEFTSSGPLQVRVAVDEELLPPAEITHSESQFSRDFAVPEALWDRPSVTVRIEVDRTDHSQGDPRELGLAFGVVQFSR